MRRFISNHSGFTLIEIIVSLIVVGIMGTMLVTFTGTTLQKSSKGVFDMVEFYQRNQIIDNITADYRADVRHRTNTALAILATNINGGAYTESYAVVTAQYITYTSANPPVEIEVDSSDYLKVTVSPASGLDGVDMVVLYTQQ